MRNQSIIQFTGSKVTHMPHPFNEGTLCNKQGGSKWMGGYYETLPEVTCKNCQKVIPQTTWSKFLWAYQYGGSVGGRTVHEHVMQRPESIKDVLIGDEQGTWLPTADGDWGGVLAVWSEFWQRWTVYYN